MLMMAWRPLRRGSFASARLMIESNLARMRWRSAPVSVVRSRAFLDALRVDASRDRFLPLVSSDSAESASAAASFAASAVASTPATTASLALSIATPPASRSRSTQSNRKVRNSDE
eukprot:Mycagemm_TRINITY_DN10287_c1_g5::TRINITY_DN10287_c1_g5_i2::g.3726::m.3726 type:complete len:116 gc:universal TRINITY_DN10287_c1_g5_i2:1291-1638(+)